MTWDGTCKKCGFQYMRKCLFLQDHCDSAGIDIEIGNINAQCKCASLLIAYLDEMKKVAKAIKPKITDCKECPSWSTFWMKCVKTGDCPK